MYKSEQLAISQIHINKNGAIIIMSLEDRKVAYSCQQTFHSIFDILLHISRKKELLRGGFGMD